MLKVTAVIKSGQESWNKEHIVNVCYSLCEANESDVLSVLHANSMSESTSYKDGSRLEGIAKGLFITEKDAEGNDKKVSLFASSGGDWDKMLTAVNDLLVGQEDASAFGVSVPASRIIGDEKVIALVSKSGMEIPNVPVLYRLQNGETNEQALERAILRQRSRWNLRVQKGTAKIKYSATQTTPME